MDSGVYALTDRFFFTDLLGLSSDENLVIIRDRNGSITSNAEPYLVDTPTLPAIA